MALKKSLKKLGKALEGVGKEIAHKVEHFVEKAKVGIKAFKDHDGDNHNGDCFYVCVNPYGESYYYGNDAPKDFSELQRDEIYREDFFDYHIETAVNADHSDLSKVEHNSKKVGRSAYEEMLEENELSVVEEIFDDGVSLSKTDYHVVDSAILI